MTFFLLLAEAAGAFILSVIGVAAWRYVAERRQILDVPNHRSLHRVPTPRGGGVLIPVILVGALLASDDAWRNWGGAGVLALAVAVLAIAGVSLWDDLRSVPTWLKFVIHLSAAALAISTIGYPSMLPVPIVGRVDVGLVGLPLALLWVVGLTNAYNFMDGIDGLAGVQAAVAGAGWMLIGSLTGVPLVGSLGSLIFGASLGFLLHNWSPARVFMGDVGSATLGFAFAVITLIGGARDITLLATGALLVWPFVFDTGLTFLRRLVHREPVFTAHRTHLYQRIVVAGYTHRWVSIAYAGLAALGLACAVIIVLAGTTGTWVSVAIVALFAWALDRFTVFCERQAVGRGAQAFLR